MKINILEELTTKFDEQFPSRGASEEARKKMLGVFLQGASTALYYQATVTMGSAVTAQEAALCALIEDNSEPN